VPMPWLKLHTEARNDAKLRSINYEIRWLWFCLLCYAGEQEPRGTIIANRKIVAVEVADGDLEKLERGLAELESLGLVTLVTTRDTCDMPLEITFKSFLKRQQKCPSDSRDNQRERKARSRQNKKLGDGSRESRVSHESVTSGHDTGEEGDKDKKTPPTPSKGKRSVFVPPDWIRPEVWSGFTAMRKSKRAANAPYALELVVKELMKLRDQGNEPNEVLEQSTRSSWTDVYPIRSKAPTQSDSKPIKPGRPSYLQPQRRVTEAPCETT
jgi:hypothetical protein